MTRGELVCGLREQGWSYGETAILLGVSRSRVGQLIKAEQARRQRPEPVARKLLAAAVALRDGLDRLAR